MTAPATLDVGVLVFSCDRYADLWTPYFASFFEQWPDCPFPVYLAANERPFDHPRVETLFSGPDQDWSSSIATVLARCPHRHVLTLFEDFFFISRVDTPRLQGLMSWAVANDARYLRLRPSPPPDLRTDNSAIGRLAVGSLYRGSLVFAFWEKSYLQSLLVPGESAWSFEVESSWRTNDEAQFFATYDEAFQYMHGVEKGRWFPDVLAEMGRRGYVSMPPARGVWTEAEVAARQKNAALRTAVRGLLPTVLRAPAHRLLWKWYRASGKVR